MSSIANLLRRLGLDRRWFEYGILDQEFLRAQCVALDENRYGSSLEHYRTAAYGRFFAPFEGRVIPAVDFDRYLELVECEADPPLRSWAVSFMTERDNLSPEQFARLAAHHLVVGTKHAFFLERNRQRQATSSEGVPE